MRRPAYVYDVYGADGWVTAETYDAIEADAIAGHAFPGVVDAGRAARGPGGLRPRRWGRLNRRLVLKHHEARSHATELVRPVPAGWPRGVARGADQARELARQVRLRWRAEAEVISLAEPSLRTMAQRRGRGSRGARGEAELRGRAVEAERALRADAERSATAPAHGVALKAGTTPGRQPWVRLGEP